MQAPRKKQMAVMVTQVDRRGTSNFQWVGSLNFGVQNSECRAHSCPSQKVLCARRGKECLKYRKSEPPILIAGLPRKAGDVTEKRSQGLYTVAERIRAQCGVVLSFLLFPFFDSFLLSLFPFEQLHGISHWEAMTPSYNVAYTDVFFIFIFLVNFVFPFFFKL